MQQQQQQERRERQQQTPAAALEASLTSEDTFEAARQAAMTMFKQRTRDLTRLTALQEQQQTLEAEQREVEAAVAELQAAQARTEANAEKEEQRVKDRTALLQQLREALHALAELQRLSADVTRATDRTVTMARGLFRTTEGSPGPAARLLQLLEEAQTRTGGRSTGDFRSLAAEVRRREAAVRDFMAESRRSATVPTALSQCVQEWTEGNWRQHRELHGVLTEGAALVAAARARPAGGRSSSPSFQRDTPTTTPVPPTLAAVATVGDDVTLDPELLLAWPTADELVGGAEDPAALVEERVSRAVETHLAELRAHEAEEAAMVARCEEHGVVAEPLEAGAVRALQADWQALRQGVAVYLAQQAAASAGRSEVAAATEALRQATAVSEAQATEARGHAEAASELDERQRVLEEQWSLSGSALAQARSTLQAQCVSLRDMDEQLQKAADELVETEAAIVAGEQEAAADAVSEAAALAAMAEAAARAEADACSAEASAIRAEEAYRTARAATEKLTGHLDEVLLALTESDGGMAEEKIARLMAEANEVDAALCLTGTPAVPGVDAEVSEVPAEAVTAAPVADLSEGRSLSDAQAELDRFLLDHEALTIDELRAFATSHQVWQLLVLLDGGRACAEAVYRAAQSIREALVQEREAEAAHHSAMEAMAKETALLTAELT